MHITISDIRNAEPCYDPIKYMREDQVVTPLEILNSELLPGKDKIWLICSVKDVLSEKELRLFAVWCARRALSLIKNPDPRSVNAVDVAEKFANGEATKKELKAAAEAAAGVSVWEVGVVAWAARAAAWAARAAAKVAAKAAAGAAAKAVAKAVAKVVAEKAARAAVWAAGEAAGEAVWVAAGEAGEAAGEAVWVAAGEKEVKEQIEYLKNLFI